MQNFVPVADNCSYTQNLQNMEGEFFCLIAEQGHYGGRTKPTTTRQGLYTCTLAGELLASINTRDGDEVAEMMRQALEKWHQKRGRAAEVAPGGYDYDPHSDRWEYPEDGLVLNLYARDLHRGSGEVDSRWNLDRVWFTRDEVNSLIPGNMVIGKNYPIPKHLARRIAKLHLVDIVRGESPRWKNEDLKQVEIALIAEEIMADRMVLRLEGTVRNEAPPILYVNPFSNQKVDMPRGLELQLLGNLTYNQTAGTFENFDVIAVGSRWGATAFNARFDDLGPAPIGFAFELASDSMIDRTPPQAILSGYFEVV